MKIVLWIDNNPNQLALANRIHAQYPLAGIIVETRNIKSKITVDKVLEKLFLSRISAAWKDLQSHYQKKYPHYPDTKILNLQNINSDEAYRFTTEIEPDLILVSGTRMIKEKMLSIKPSIGILNLHTGLSPYIKGGPNCTNWCISTNQLHLIGNTVMWIDIGVDTGNIITTEITEFTGNETLLGVHIKVMDHAHSLYLKAVEKLISGERSSVSQNSITKGITYYNKEWKFKQKLDLLINFMHFKRNITSPEYAKQKAAITTIKI